MTSITIFNILVATNKKIVKDEDHFSTSLQFLTQTFLWQHLESSD